MASSNALDTPETAKEIFKLLCQTRALQECLIINRKKIPGPLLTGLGQEAVSVVSTYVLRKTFGADCIIHPDHRTMYGAIVTYDGISQEKTDSLVLDLLRNYFCKKTGGNLGRDGNVHIGWPHVGMLPFMSSDMGRMAGVTIGCVEEMQRKTHWHDVPEEARGVGVTFFGDGAAQQGGVHEAMNWAAARNVPIIFGINNNHVALFANSYEEHGKTKLFRRARGYGNMKGMAVDGNDPIKIVGAMLDAIEHAQQGNPVLIEFNTYRLTGHNEDQIKRRKGSIENGDFFDVENVFGVEDLGVFKEAVLYEPILKMRSILEERCEVETEEMDILLENARSYVHSLAEKVLQEPDISLEDDAKDRSVFKKSTTETISAVSSEKTKKRKYNEAFRWTIGTIMKEDPKVTYFGEDVRSKEGGVLGLTRGLSDVFDNDRLFSTPISEEAIVANAVGRAFSQGKPFCEFQFAPFFGDSFPMLFSLAPQWYQKKFYLGCTMIMPSGVVHGGSSGHYHEAWVERYLPDGIVVVAPSNAYEVSGLVRSAYEFENPVAILLQISSAAMSDFIADVPEEPFTIPFGKAHVVRSGDDCSVVVYGAACVAAAKNEADALAKNDGINIEVIDLRTVHPWDKDTIKSSISKTGRLIIMHEDYFSGGIGQRIKGELLEDDSTLPFIKTPSVRVLGATHPFISTAQTFVWDSLPYEVVEIDREDGKGRKSKDRIHRSSKLARMVKEVMEYR